MIYVGVDTGGTFTDFVVWQNGKTRTHKVLSTPAAPEKAILHGLDALDLTGKSIVVIHGSTVATNAVLEGKGVSTAYITNKGFADVLTIGRQARKELYNLQPSSKPVPVEPAFCLEVDCRIAADGTVLSDCDDNKLQMLLEQLQSLNVRAIAINLLFSYVNDQHEQQLLQALQDSDKQLFVTLSSEVLAEIGEYERGMATWLNAWIGPLIQGYVDRLQQALGSARLAIMQSSGETMAASLASRQAVRMLLSGPAGGLVGAREIAAMSGFDRLMTFDMGGTSSDVALLDHGIALTRRGKLAGYPVAVPMVDMHTIGAGGGSLAYLDEGGLLHVGPESAGADPGPACYGRGGLRPTVTDANLVLGRIPASARLGGDMPLDYMAAVKVIDHLAESMGLSRQKTAQGIVDIANEHMARALRVISVQKGYDPKEFVLVSFGGAGGMHVCALADALGMQQAMVPVYGGVLSALGMLATAPGRQLSRSVLTRLSDMSESDILLGFEELKQQGVLSLQDENITADQVNALYSLELRYQGQSNTLNLEWTSIEQSIEAFHNLHESRYGHRLDVAVELAGIRVSLIAESLPVNFQKTLTKTYPAGSNISSSDQVPLYDREHLAVGQRLNGPAIIIEDVATTWLAQSWQAEVDNSGNLILDKIQ